MVTRRTRPVVNKDNEKQKEDDKKIQVVQGNIPLLTVQLLNSINQNLGVLITYLKHRDIEKK